MPHCIGVADNWVSAVSARDSASVRMWKRARPFAASASKFAPRGNEWGLAGGWGHENADFGPFAGTRRGLRVELQVAFRQRTGKMPPGASREAGNPPATPPLRSKGPENPDLMGRSTRNPRLVPAAERAVESSGFSSGNDYRPGGRRELRERWQRAMRA